MSAFQQAFSKWLEKAGDSARKNAPEIVEALEALEAAKGTKAHRSRGQSQTRGVKPSADATPSGGTRATGNAASARRANDSSGHRPAVASDSRTPKRSGGEARHRAENAHVSADEGPARNVRQDVPVQRKAHVALTPMSNDAFRYEPGKTTTTPLPDHREVVMVSTSDLRIFSAGRGMKAATPTDPADPQIRGIRRKATKPRVQVGLDFGTSSTKVLCKRLDIAGQARPVDFGHGLPGYASFAMPSVAVFDTTGQLVLGDRAVGALGKNWQQGITAFKMLAAGRSNPAFLDVQLDERYRRYVRKTLKDERACPPEMLCAVYLAFVMRRVRRWLESDIGSTDIEVLFNTCVPVDQRQDANVYAAFCHIAAVAQKLESEGHDSDTALQWLKKAHTLWPDTQYVETDDSTRLFVIPEAIAATAGYLSSERKSPGLHALVDIGAGTADVSIFNLSSSRSTGLTTELLGARSIPLGTASLEHEAATNARSVGLHWDREELLEALGGKGPQASSCRKIVEGTLWRIWNGTVPAWAEACRKNPGQSKWSGNAVRIFVSGGGALLPESTAVFSESWQGWGPYPTRVMPGPDVGLEKTDLPFARLCVAFGLTVPRGDLGHFVMPDDVPVNAPPQTFKIDYSQDGDQLIPRWGWT